MIHPQALTQMFGYNLTLIEKQIAGASHADSLKQPPNTPNSLNWLLGHIVSSRTIPTQRVGETPVWSDQVRAPYRNGSLPITADGEGVLRIEVILDALRESQARILHGLSRMSYEDLCQTSGHESNTIGQSLGYFYFHECYHIGQVADVATALGRASVWL